MEEKVEKIFDKMFENYISPSRFEKLFKEWDFHDTFRGKVEGIPIKEFIEKCLLEGFEVKSGYMATSIKDAHDFYILTRIKK